MNAQVRARVAKELEAIPRGSPAQNLYRMVYEQVRLNGLGTRAELPDAPCAAHEVALRTVTELHPDFQPELS
jgi:hypothetical protein